VQRKIGADWLVYQDLDDLVAAVQHEKADIDGFDTSCFSGEYVTGDVSRAYLDALEIVRSNSAKARRDARVRAEESESEDDTMQVASGL
jgi:amidophosphoribosyltransferase